MSKTLKFASLTIMLVVALLLVADTSLAQGAGQPTRYKTYTATCVEYPPEQVWIAGQVLHIRGMVTTGRTFGDAHFAGHFTNYTDIDLNLVTASGNVHGTTKIVPEAYDGTWQGGHFTGPIIEHMYTGQGIDYGTGELAGLMDVVQIQQIDPSQLPADFVDPCGGNPVLSAFLANGMILEQGEVAR
jgi:hypothetical protein